MADKIVCRSSTITDNPSKSLSIDERRWQSSILWNIVITDITYTFTIFVTSLGH